MRITGKVCDVTLVMQLHVTSCLMTSLDVCQRLGLFLFCFVSNTVSPYYFLFSGAVCSGGAALLYPDSPSGELRDARGSHLRGCVLPEAVLAAPRRPHGKQTHLFRLDSANYCTGGSRLIRIWIIQIPLHSKSYRNRTPVSAMLICLLNSKWLI